MPNPTKQESIHRAIQTPTAPAGDTKNCPYCGASVEVDQRYRDPWQRRLTCDECGRYSEFVPTRIGKLHQAHERGQAIV